MEVLVNDMHKNGAVFFVAITFEMTVTKGFLKIGQKPPFVRAKAVIDTGAERTCLDSSISEKLALQVYDTARIATLSGIAEVNMVDVLIHIPELNRCFPVCVPSVDFGGKSYQVVIGRDILRKCKFEYDGINNLFKLSL